MLVVAILRLAAPHRLSTSDDYELCVITSIVSTSSVYNDVLRVVTEFKQGVRTLRNLEIGKNLAKALTSCLQELEHRMITEMCLVAPMLVYLDVIQSKIDKDFYKALRMLLNALQVSDVVDSIELVKTIDSIGGHLQLLLRKTDITARRISIENLTLYNVLDELAKQSPMFECFTNTQKILNVIRLSERLYNEHKNINTALSKVFIKLAKEKIDIANSDNNNIVEILKVDAKYRREGLDLTFLLTYLAYAALYLVKMK
uniref:Uncharacterized protein n=1 Tax=Ignisphaera aggregans TaxID=334771 RepID=A0A7C2VB50_9CREN